MKKDDDDRGDKEVLLTPLLLIKFAQGDKEAEAQLEEWGLLTRKGKTRRRFTGLTDKGLRESLNVSLSVVDDGEKKGGNK